MTPQIITDIFAQAGTTVALIILLLYWVFVLQKKIIAIVENNTAAMVSHKDAMEKLADRIGECPINGVK